MKRYYLGEEVEAIAVFDNGWCLTQWPGGQWDKFWMMWLDQLKESPWGEALPVEVVR